MRQNCGEFGEQDKWETQSVNHARSLQGGTGLIAIIVGTVITGTTVISASG